MNSLTQRAKICFIAAGVCLIVGVITEGSLWYIGLLIFGIIGFIDIFKKTGNKQEPSNNEETQEDINQDDYVSCPYCAEKIKKKAKICRFCGKDV